MIKCKNILKHSLALSACVLVGCVREDLSQNPGAVETLTESGISQLVAYDFSAAYQQLQRAQPHWEPNSEQEEKGSYALALASWHMSPPDDLRLQLATELLEKLTLSSNRNLAAQAHLDLGRIHEVKDHSRDTVDLEAARKHYSQVLESHDKSSPYAYKAALRLAQTYAQELTPESIEQGIALLEAVDSEQPPAAWHSVVTQYIGDLYGIYLENPSDALAFYSKTRDAGFVSEARGDKLLWRMAEWAEAANQTERARELYSEIPEIYPRSPFQDIAQTKAAQLEEASQE